MSALRERLPRQGGDDEFGEVLGPATTAVERWYQAFGVEHRPEQRDLPDHVATELEFCAYLAEHGRDDRLDQFCEEHLTAWTDEYLVTSSQKLGKRTANCATTTREATGRDARGAPRICSGD